MSPSALSGDYQFFGTLMLPFMIIGFVMVAVGTYLRYDGRPGHKTLGTVSAAVGFLTTVLGQVITTQITAEDTVACSIFGERCRSQSAWGFFWGNLLWPFLLDTIVVGAAALVGILAARVTRRNNSKSGNLRSMLKEELHRDSDSFLE